MDKTLDFKNPKENPIFKNTIDPSLKLNLDKEIDPKLLDVAAIKTSILSKDIIDNMQSSDVTKFDNVLKDLLPKSLYEYIKSLSPTDIAMIMATILISIPLIATGVGIIPVVTGIVARL